MCNGALVKSLKINTRSNCFNPYWTRSSEAISISDRVTTKKGGSVRWTKHSVVGCNRALVRNGTPSNDNSLNGTSNSRVSPFYVSCQRLAKDQRKYNKLKSMQPRQFSLRRLWFLYWVEPCVFFLVVPSQFRPRHRSDVYACDCQFRRTVHQWLHGRIARPKFYEIHSNLSKGKIHTKAFFLPIMIGALRWRWTITMSSWSHGWKKRCLMLLNKISK